MIDGHRVRHRFLSQSAIGHRKQSRLLIWPRADEAASFPADI